MSHSPVSSHSPHAAVVGRSARWLGRFHFSGLFWYRFHRWGVRTCPDRLVGLFLFIFVTFFFLLLAKVRRAIAANLDVVLGSAGWWERQRRAYRTILNHAWCLTERYERHATARAFRIEVEGLEHWNAVVDRGGFVAVTAHLGAWEVSSMIPAEVEQRVVHVVREPEQNDAAQQFTRALLREMEAQGIFTHFASDDPALGLELLDALRRGEIVALQADRPRGGGGALPVTLFGRPFPLPLGVFALARVAGAPLLPVFALRCGRRRYRVRIHPPIAIDQALPRDEALATAARQVAAVVEAEIRAEPYQWFCFGRLW